MTDTPVAGNYREPTVTVPTADGSTAASLLVIKPDGTEVDVSGESMTVTDGVGTGTADAYLVDAPGIWTERWTVTGVGAGFATFQFTALPAQPSPDLTGRTYATSQDYANYYGITAALPSNIQSLLRRATLQVDRVLQTAVYTASDTGSDGRPISYSLRDAVCEQVAYNLATGRPDGLPSGFQSVSIGSVQLSRGYSSAGGTADDFRFSDLALAVLQSAGLLGMQPATEIGVPVLAVVVDSP